MTTSTFPLGDNGGPPLDPRPWGEGKIRGYFEWAAARHAAFHNVPRETAVRRARKAALLGLTYEEYALEILERGRFLQVTDRERIAAIKARRPIRY